MKLEKISYNDLNSKQKENYNFAKVSAILADYGFFCLWLNDDWNGADFLAVPREGKTLKVQLKGRLAFNKKYIGKDIYVCFRHGEGCFLYPHDKLLEICTKKKFPFTTGSNLSWKKNGEASWRKPTSMALEVLNSYYIQSLNESYVA